MSNETQFLNARIEALTAQNKILTNTIKSIKMHLENTQSASKSDAEYIINECIFIAKKQIQEQG